jgi:hypothetical protein
MDHRHKVKVILLVIFWAFSAKLVVSQWAVGDLSLPIAKTINYTCDGVILFAAIWAILYVNPKFLYIYVIAGVTGISYAVSTSLFTNQQSWEMMNNHLKIYLPLVLFPVLLRAYELNPHFFIRLVKNIGILASLLFIYGLIFLPNSMNRLEEWWPVYFGGLHITAYVLLALTLVVYYLMRLKEISSKLAVALIIFMMCCINFGLGVRTAVLAFLVFVMFQLSNKLTYNKKTIFKVLPLLVLVSVILFMFVYGIDDKLTSGRFSMYMDKYEQLMSNGLSQWLIGNGYKSDLIETDVWWWAAKGAHSDLITMLVEGGVFYLAGFFLVLYRLYTAGSHDFKCVLLAMVTTSVFSNGVFVRPLAGYLFMFVLVLMFHRELPRQESV